MSDVRTLLHETAATPTREPDVAAARRVARSRRRRQRGLVSFVALLVAALSAVGLVRATGGGGSSTRVAIGPRETTDVPDGWSSVELESGISFAMPPEWDVFDFGNTAVAERRIAIGTARPTDDSVMMACTPGIGQVPAEAGTWISLWEYADPTASEVAAPAGGGILGVRDRPADFRSVEPTGTACRFAGDATTGELGAAFEELAFRQAGRVFVARVVTAYPVASDASDQRREQLEARLDALTSEIDALNRQIAADPTNADELRVQLQALQNQYQVEYESSRIAAQAGAATPDPAAPSLALAGEVLNSLRISALAPVTSIPATTPPGVTVPASTVPATTAPPFVPASTDEEEITQLFVAWQRVNTDDEVRAIVEDGDALLGVIHEGMAQHTDGDLAKYSGRVEAIRMVDADHAHVDYTLLFDGRPQFGVRTGTAVKIDGVWKVSRDTECALLSLGGITCPARANS